MKKILMIMVLILLIVPGAVTAQETSSVDSGDTAWMIVATTLVLFMTIPGLSLFYGGLVRTKNVLSILVQCFAITAMITILWIIYGYSVAFSTAGMKEGVFNFYSFFGGLETAFLSGINVESVSGSR
jgi:Amt family ammonium transporter